MCYDRNKKTRLLPNRIHIAEGDAKNFSDTQMMTVASDAIEWCVSTLDEVTANGTRRFLPVKRYKFPIVQELTFHEIITVIFKRSSRKYHIALLCENVF